MGIVRGTEDTMGRPVGLMQQVLCGEWTGMRLRRGGVRFGGLQCHKRGLVFIVN